MIKYWPHRQSIELNHEVALLFAQTKNKFASNLLENTTNDLLSIDIIDNHNKSKIFHCVLKELEILILDIIELDLNIENIKLLNHKMLYDLIEKTLLQFISNDKILKEVFQFKKNISYNSDITFFEHKLLLENVLIYLVFGSNYIQDKIFAFDNLKTPQKHVSILLENLVIQTSNFALIQIIEETYSLSELISFLIDNNLCNSSYLSIRSIALFRNNLIIQNLKYRYINQPRAIYGARYKVWLLGFNGLICKYIYTSRLEDLPKLSKPKLIFIILIELQDIILPKLEQLLLILGKIILYVLINIVGTSIVFLIRTIISGLQNKNK